jgi:uncharacterized protein YbjT (DUF2867 family)
MSDNVLNNNKTVQIEKESDLFCHDLPTKPQHSIGKILVTGASGYIGGRLVPELLARGYKVRIMLRAPSPEYEELWPGVEVVVADAFDMESLRRALDGIDTLYYLIHSLLLGPEDFMSADVRAAMNFREVAAEKKVKRIIYLGGLGDITADLSPHLASRIEVAEELKRGPVPVTLLRAAIIIGSGSASYEIIQYLVRRLPILPIPRWATNNCQPIAIRDVVKYLVGVLEIPNTSGSSFDIGGPDILSYQLMMKMFAEMLNKRRVFFRFFISYIRIYSYLAGLLTPVPAPITAALMEGLKNEVVCRNSSIKELIPMRLLTYKEAIVAAMSREERDDVRTRWSGAYPPAHELELRLHEIDDDITYTAKYSLITDKNPSSLFQSICSIGGEEGWFKSSWMWSIRGMIDKLVRGVGTARGRRSQKDLKINDVIDFWRIEEIQLNKRLLLRAEMKMPGKAWLDFTIDEEENRNKLSVAPYFHTHSLPGRVYWYILFPFHHFIFNDLLKQIVRKS